MARIDEEIKKDIVDQLYWDSRVDAADVRAEVDDGRVHLSGTVHGFKAKKAAEFDAWVVPEVVEVKNNLSVRPADGTGIPADDDIRVNVENILILNPDIDAGDVRISVDAGCVTLEGNVDSYYKKMEAEEIISGLAGIKEVVNTIVVTPSETIEDRIIAGEIMSALKRNVAVPIDAVTVEVDGGSVSLYGSVPDWNAHQAAENAASYTAGVREIDNNLRIARLE